MLQCLAYLRELNMASIMVRLLCAMAFGGAVGIERGRKRRPAGFRTYMLVCLGAALTMLLSQYMVYMQTGPWAVQIHDLGLKNDVSRFGAQVVNGIGFVPTPVGGKNSKAHRVGDCVAIGNLRTVIWRAWDICMRI